MKKALVLLLLAGSLALSYYAEPALACPSPLQCSNFTEPDKIEDCDYVIHQNLNPEEEQQVLCILWDQTYNSNGLYQPSFFSHHILFYTIISYFIYDEFARIPWR